MSKVVAPSSRMPASVRILLTIFILCVPGSLLACEPFVEEHPGRTSASFRPNTNAFDRCPVSEHDYHAVVRAWLGSRAPEDDGITSLSLGRAVSFPWLSRYIADAALQSPQWAARVREARPGTRDKLAVDVLQDPALLKRLAVPFEGSRYEVTRISFEKVLFGRADEYSSTKSAGAVLVPFDAQLWLRLAVRK